MGITYDMLLIPAAQRCSYFPAALESTHARLLATRHRARASPADGWPGQTPPTRLRAAAAPEVRASACGSKAMPSAHARTSERRTRTSPPPRRPAVLETPRRRAQPVVPPAAQSRSSSRSVCLRIRSTSSSKGTLFVEATHRAASAIDANLSMNSKGGRWRVALCSQGVSSSSHERQAVRRHHENCATERKRRTKPAPASSSRHSLLPLAMRCFDLFWSSGELIGYFLYLSGRPLFERV